MPARARAEARLDARGTPEFDIGAETAISVGLAWLSLAQDCSATRDGGIARHYSLLNGWSSSYPETTGYIVDTFVSVGTETGSSDLIQRAHRMLDWLVSIQFPEGAFQGGMVDQLPRLAATFDTGQVLIGLSAGAHLGGKYHSSMLRAADWMVATQDGDGCWRQHDTPFVSPGEKVYEAHAALGLFRAAATEQSSRYLDAACAQINWALQHQRRNGWLAKCCLTDPTRPLTHTIGYAIRGIVEAYLATKSARFLDAAISAADGLLGAIQPDGRLSGRLYQDWQPAASWVCLTGSSQVAESLFLLAGVTNNEAYCKAGKALNAFVRRTVVTTGPAETRGAVKGSFPVDGEYGRWQYLNWACKFMIDANRAELKAGGDGNPIV